MKPTQSLLLNKQNVQIIESEIQLALNAIGSARFIVHSNSHLDSNQVLQYFRGFDQFQPRLAFIGLIESIEKLEKNTYQITALEPASVLEKHHAYFALRFCSLEDICNKITELSKLPIHTPTIQKKTPTDGIIAQFNQLSNFRNSLQQAMLAFNVPNGCLLTMRDGSLYVGNLTQSPPFQKQTLQLPNQWILEHKNHYTTTIPYPFRPANILNINGSDQIVYEVIMRDSLVKMKAVKWAENMVKDILSNWIPGEIINKSSYPVWVFTSQHQPPNMEGTAYILKPGYKTPSNIDADGFRPVDESVKVNGTRTDTQEKVSFTLSQHSNFQWWKFPTGATLTLHDAGGAIQIEYDSGTVSKIFNQHGLPIKEENHNWKNRIFYDDQTNWGVALE